MGASPAGWNRNWRRPGRLRLIGRIDGVGGVGQESDSTSDSSSSRIPPVFRLLMTLPGGVSPRSHSSHWASSLTGSGGGFSMTRGYPSRVKPPRRSLDMAIGDLDGVLYRRPERSDDHYTIVPDRHHDRVLDITDQIQEGSIHPDIESDDVVVVGQ